MHFVAVGLVIPLASLDVPPSLLVEASSIPYPERGCLVGKLVTYLALNEKLFISLDSSLVVIEVIEVYLGIIDLGLHEDVVARLPPALRAPHVHIELDERVVIYYLGVGMVDNGSVVTTILDFAFTRGPTFQVPYPRIGVWSQPYNRKGSIYVVIG